MNRWTMKRFGQCKATRHIKEVISNTPVGVVRWCEKFRASRLQPTSPHHPILSPTHQNGHTDTTAGRSQSSYAHFKCLNEHRYLLDLSRSLLAFANFDSVSWSFFSRLSTLSVSVLTVPCNCSTSLASVGFSMLFLKRERHSQISVCWSGANHFGVQANVKLSSC